MTEMLQEHQFIRGEDMMADYRRILTIERLSTKEVLTFPITPFPKFTESVSHDTVNIYGNGEMVTGHNRQLTRCSINGIFPGNYARETNKQKLLDYCNRSRKH